MFHCQSWYTGVGIDDYQARSYSILSVPTAQQDISPPVAPFCMVFDTLLGCVPRVLYPAL